MNFSKYITSIAMAIAAVVMNPTTAAAETFDGPGDGKGASSVKADDPNMMKVGNNFYKWYRVGRDASTGEIVSRDLAAYKATTGIAFGAEVMGHYDMGKIKPVAQLDLMVYLPKFVFCLHGGYMFGLEYNTESNRAGEGYGALIGGGSGEFIFYQTCKTRDLAKFSIRGGIDVSYINTRNENELQQIETLDSYITNTAKVQGNTWAIGPLLTLSFLQPKKGTREEVFFKGGVRREYYLHGAEKKFFFEVGARISLTASKKHYVNLP